MLECFDILNKDVPHQRFFVCDVGRRNGRRMGREIDGLGRRHGERRGNKEVGTGEGQIECRCYSGVHSMK